MFHNLENYNIIFYGQDLIVVAKLFDLKECVVTFTSHGNDNELPQVPFGGNMLNNHHISHVCIISLSNHWWSTPEWLPCLKIVKSYISANHIYKTVLYGGSMGGYGALLASQHLAPDRVVVFGAQFSISPKVIPEDSRWKSDWKELFSITEMVNAEVPSVSEVIYIYDPYTIDKFHAQRYRNLSQIHFIRLPFSGHEVFNTLKELKLAGEIALYALSFYHSIDSIRQYCCFSYRKKKRNSQSYWKNILSYKKENRLKEAAVSFLIKETELNFVSKLALADELNKTAKNSKIVKDIYFNAISELSIHSAPWRGLWNVYAKEEKYLLSLKSALIALANRENDEDLLRVVILAANAVEYRKLVVLVASILLEKDKNGVHTLNVLNKANFNPNECMDVTSEMSQKFHNFLVCMRKQAMSLRSLDDFTIEQMVLPHLEDF